MTTRALDDAALARAAERALFERFRLVNSLKPSVLHEDADECWQESEDADLNIVYWARYAGGEADARVDARLSHYAGRPVTWVVGPSSAPADLAARVEARGLKAVADDPLMVVALHGWDPPAPLPAGATVERVRDEDALAGFVDVGVEGFGTKPEEGEERLRALRALGLGDDSRLRHVVVALDGRPVAIASVWLGDEGTAEIFSVAVRPDARRRGLGRAVTVAAAREAKDAGYGLVTLMADSEMGRPMYRTLGFREVGRVRQFERPEAI